ncbi:MAG TPA: dihydrodipicolinate synthase family protein [Opitutus sp.]|nr:dihydrodipicolinate synthase family protein [Opitutus sp.]
MSASLSPAGIIVPLITPVTAEGQLDEPAAERLVGHVAGAGCGLLVAGTTGEVASLPSALRERYVEIAVRIAAKRVPVFACIAHNSLDEAVALGRRHLVQGADALVGMLPNYFKLEPAEMQRYFALLADRVGGALYLYNMPATTGMSLPLDAIDALARHPSIVGMKDSEPTAGRREAVAQRFGGRGDFALFMGVAAHAVPALRLGFHGIVPSSGNYAPALWRDLHAAAKAGDWNRAETLQTRALALGAVFQNGRALGSSLAALKAGVSRLGICGPHMLPPLAALAAAEQRQVHEQLSQLS